MRHVRHELKLQETALGAECAIALQVRNLIYLLSLGQCSVLSRCAYGEDTGYLRFSSEFNLRLGANVVNPGFAFDHPIGFFADDQLEFGIERAAFEAGGDLVILTSWPLPNDHSGYSQLCTSLKESSEGKSIVLHLCRNYAPPVQDSAAVTLQRTEANDTLHRSGRAVVGCS